MTCVVCGRIRGSLPHLASATDRLPCRGSWMPGVRIARVDPDVAQPTADEVLERIFGRGGA